MWGCLQANKGTPWQQAMGKHIGGQSCERPDENVFLTSYFIPPKCKSVEYGLLPLLVSQVIGGCSLRNSYFEKIQEHHI